MHDTFLAPRFGWPCSFPCFWYLLTFGKWGILPCQCFLLVRRRHTSHVSDSRLSPRRLLLRWWPSFSTRVGPEQRSAFGKRCSAFGVWFGRLNAFGSELCSFLNVFGDVFVFVRVRVRVRAESLLFLFVFVFGGSVVFRSCSALGSDPCLCSCSCSCVVCIHAVWLQLGSEAPRGTLKYFQVVKRYMRCNLDWAARLPQVH